MSRTEQPGIGLGSTDSALFPMLDTGPVNILIMDDDPRNLNVLEAILDDPGYRLIRVESGDQALTALVEMEFALLILDVRMPDLSGFELAQMIKGRKKTAEVPIIFLTAYYNEDQDVLAGYSSGAVDFLHKPVNPKILRSKVSVFVELYRKNRERAMANLALQAEVAERRKAQNQLYELNETLELRVAERATALLENEERYRTLFELGPVAVYSCDTTGMIQDYNQRAAELWGRSPLPGDPNERYCGSYKLFRTDGSYMPHDQCPMRMVLAGEIPEARDMDVTIERPDGTRIACVINIRSLKDQNGQITGAINCFYDITERKRFEEELTSAKAAAEKANLAKSEFLSNMSHDLRTPLNAILGFAQLMEAGSPPPTVSQKRGIEQIVKAGWYLLDLINEILDLALIESGKLPLLMEPISLTEVLRESKAMIEPQSRARGIQVRFPEFDKPCYVQADRTRMKQVMTNLLSNAIKYNKAEGNVLVECTTISPDHIRISVKDTGEGMTPDQLSHLFQPFNRLGKETSAEQGTGIGLVMTKRLVEMMGGMIGVESTVGEGSCFWVDLALADGPVRVEKNTAPAIQAHAPGGMHTLLYVEDNPANLMLVEDIIAGRSDIRLLTAMDGQRGIEIAVASRPDVILVDINLPNINGLTVLRMLSDNPITAKIPVIALSANAMPSDIEKGLQAGFFRYLTKPIKVNELLFTLDVALEFAIRQPARTVN